MPSPGTSLDFKTGNWRSTEVPVHVHAKAPCHAACPAGEDQQAWFAKLQEGHAEEAWQRTGRRQPAARDHRPRLPASLRDRLQPRPDRRRAGDPQCRTLAGRRGDRQRLGLSRSPPPPTTRQPWRSSAPVPAGCRRPITASRHGLRAEIFEALPEAGGLLRSGIPPTRLPRDVLDAEPKRLLALPGITLNLRARAWPRRHARRAARQPRRRAAGPRLPAAQGLGRARRGARRSARRPRPAARIHGSRRISRAPRTSSSTAAATPRSTFAA